MKRIVFLLTVLSMFFLSACGNDNEPEQNQEVPALLEVDLRLPEGKVDPGSQIILEAYVSQGGEAVEDANEVKFEVLRKGEAESEAFEGEHQEEGVYTAQTTLAEEGVYSITAHVTARDMHNMPSKELVVGNPSETESHLEDHSEHGSHDEKAEDHNEQGDATDGHHHDHASPVKVELQSGLELQANENNELSALIKKDNQPLTGAKVSFEVWKEGAEHHDFIDATEAGEGIYKANKTFNSTGTYSVNVHINTDDLHEHQLIIVTVK